MDENFCELFPGESSDSPFFQFGEAKLGVERKAKRFVGSRIPSMGNRCYANASSRFIMSNHDANAMKYLSISILILFLFLCRLVSGQDKSLTGNEIVAKHLVAVGGKEALLKLKTRVALGTVKKESEADAELAIFSELPNRISANYRFEKYDWKLRSDGTKVIFFPPISRKLYMITDKYNEMLASGLMFNSVTLSNVLTEAESSGVKFEAKGTRKLHGRAAYVVEVKRGKGDAFRLYFDAEDFMWVRTDYGHVTISKQMGAFTNDAVFHGEDEIGIDFYIETSDFRNVDGIKLPFKFEQVITYPILQQKIVGTISDAI